MVSAQVYNEKLLPHGQQEIFIKHVTDLNEAEYDFVSRTLKTN